MKTNDLIGFAAILSAGYITGKDHANVSWTGESVLLIVALLAVGYYFAVHLS